MNTLGIDQQRDRGYTPREETEVTDPGKRQGYTRQEENWSNAMGKPTRGTLKKSQSGARETHSEHWGTSNC